MSKPEKTKKTCTLCNKWAEPHHIKTRGSGGGDEESNILYLCRLHHIEAHKIGQVKFIEKYVKLNQVYLEKGWQVVNEFGRKRLRRL